MAHLHSVYDSDTHFSIDVITRTLKNESSKKTMVIQNDHNSERFTFELPRFIEGHDMMQCNKTEVHYLNIDTQKGTQVEGVYEVDDLMISPEDEETVIFSWLISRNATQFVGSLNFVITFKCLDDEGMVQYAWNTAIHSRISVSSGIQNTKDIVLEYADVLEQWKNNLIAVEKSAKQFVDESVAEYVEAYPLMMQVADDHIQYKMGEVEWINVVALEDIKGDKGDKGDTGEQGIQGETGISPTFTIKQFEGGATITATDINGTTTAKLYDGGGEDGKDGTGIQSIEQTTTSEEDDGNNVITIGLTDGSFHEFTVQNGSKGSDGKAAYECALDGGYEGTEEEFNSMLGELGLVLSSTLVAGNTTLTITDERITTDSILDSVYTSIFGVKVKSAVFNEGSLILEFPIQTENMEVKVYLNLGSNKEDAVGNGKSAYQYAVDGGFEGTEAEFLELMGDIGNFDSVVASFKEEILASVNDMGEWKLVGSASGSSQITLPTDFNELYIEINANFSNGTNAFNTSTNIIKQSLSSTVKTYYLPVIDTAYSQSSGSFTEASIKITDTYAKIDRVYNNKNVITNYSGLYVYYR